MSFSDCIRSAVQQGALDASEGDDLIRRYQAHVEANRGAAGPGGPEAAAKEALLKDVTDAAARKERLADLAADKAEAIAAHLDAFRDSKGRPDVTGAALALLENRNNRLGGAPSVIGRRDALLGYAHGRLEEMLYEFRRSAGLGKRRNPARLDAMVDEAFGQATGDGAARDFVAAWRTVADELVDRFNAAGGALPKIKDYFPQRHDARDMLKAGPQAWAEFIAPRLDLDKMRDPVSGAALSEARLRDILPDIYKRIVTDGAIDREPSGAALGRGALANQRQDARFLVFKDAKAWREYNVAFGGNDVYGALMGHIQGLAKDVAALETLGPNPNATVEWLKQIVDQQAAKKLLGQESLYFGDPAKRATGPLGGDAGRIDRLWTVVNGSQGVGNMAAADAMTGLRNVLMSAQLSATAVTAAAGDPWQQAWAKRFAGVSNLRWFADLPRQMFDGASKRDLIRAGVVFADAQEHLVSDLRWHGLTAASAEYSRWLPDRMFQWTGLTPWTNVNRRSQAMSFMFEAGDRVGQTLADMRKDGVRGERFARWLEGFGIGEGEWATIRAARPLDHGEAGGMLRMMDVIDAHPGDARAFDVALRYGEAVHAFMEEAVPQGTAWARSALGRGLPAGTAGGEAMRSLMYLGYPVTTLWSLGRAAATEIADGGWRGAGFLASAVIGLTIGGATMVQLSALRRGQDPRSVLPSEDPTFWLEAMAKGGALGFWGDYLIADMKRGAGDTVARLAGPPAALAGDVLSLVNPRALASDDETDRGKLAAKLAQKYTPAPWWIKPATDRLIFDRLQLLADPAAYRQWRTKERQLHDETGQGVWWGKGESAPRRMPDWGHVVAR